MKSGVTEEMLTRFLYRKVAGTAGTLLILLSFVETSNSGIGRYLHVTNNTNETVLLSRVRNGDLRSLGRLEPGQSRQHYIGEPNDLTVVQADGRVSGKLWRLSIRRDKVVDDCSWTISPGGPFLVFDCE